MILSPITLFLLLKYSLGAPIVDTNDGTLRGQIFKDYNGNDFYSFRSVPFAKPPIGKERFKDPKPVEKWIGVKDAVEDIPVCFQKQREGVFIGSEDCLYLNVHTPEISEILKPVMMFIHGGAFLEGSGRHDLYGPEFLVTTGVVLVTINYRLGFQGFVNFDNPKLDVPGNAGLKDQLMALKWIKRNIRYFGGDPDNVTIFGESAGGASVHFHVISPASRGYFNKAIAMSGAALAPWCNGMQNNGVLIARKLGYQGDDELEMLELLQRTDFNQIEQLFDDSPFFIPFLHKVNLLGPTIERQHDNAFITDSVANVIKAGNFDHKVPFMIGYTDQDGMFVDAFSLLKLGKYEPWPVDWYIPKYFNLSEIQKTNVIEEITAFYFKNGRSVQTNIDLNTDGFFAWSIYNAAFAHMQRGQDVFLYLFASDTNLNRLKLMSPVTAGYKGACHMDELGHLFTSSFMPEVAKGSIEDKSMKVIVNLFTNFAKDGQPTREGFNLEWSKADSKTMRYIEIKNDEVEIGSFPDKGRPLFWMRLLEKYGPETEILCNSSFL